MAPTNFLIGRGEMLTAEVPPPKRNPEKAAVYTREETKVRLAPQLAALIETVDKLPSEAAPDDFAVARIAMNPSYVAKSYFPEQLLVDRNLEAIGSRAVRVKPAKWSRKAEPVETVTTEILVAGKRSAFRSMRGWLQTLPEREERDRAADDATHVESIEAMVAQDRLRISDTDGRHYEVGVHFLGAESEDAVRQAFARYAARCDVRLHSNLSFQAGNLWFVPAEGSKDSIRRLAEFALVRVIRPMPRLRGLRPVARGTATPVGCQLPRSQPLSAEPRVAVLDAGLPDAHLLQPWVRDYRRLDDAAADDPDGPPHGLAVTSALLFGPIPPNGAAARPYSYVDHLRVLDRETDQEDPLELYRTLGFIEEVLLSRRYEFLNLSLGPALPIEDSDVHAWTSVIDEILSDGSTLLTVAAGNNGEQDRASGNARIQVPADCVNALAVGAATSTGTRWKRASYSAVGPGRRPGIIKPDVLAFGGDPTEYFHALVHGNAAALAPLLGTSFAAPYVLRSAVGIRAILGSSLSTLAIKALLIHSAKAAGQHVHDVGWGTVPEDVDAIITSPPGIARVVYQGDLKPGKYLRARIPMPKTGMQGRVKLSATFCFASRIDPQDAVSYTRAGLEVSFRPNAGKKAKGSELAKTRTFFDDTPYAHENELRSERGKWETVLHASHTVLGSNLDSPVFDIHYVARQGGGQSRGSEKIPYALVISIEAPKHIALYEDILAAYPQLLVPIEPQVPIPIRT